RETDPPEKGAEAPDWFYVPNVPPRLDGQYRRSYVLWREYIVPLIAIEFASGDGSEELDNTPLSRLPEGGNQKPGKFWVYERIIRIPYYAIYKIQTNELEVYNWVNTRYIRLEPNDRGHYPIDLMGVELGVWEGSYQNQAQQWLRWWDNHGNLLLTGSERARLERLHTEQERERADAERERADAERERADAERERADIESQRADIESQRAEAERQQAEAERQRADREHQQKERLAAYLRSQGIDPDLI
ncbi:Uma2 family endonuclease, partial [Microcoleus sp. herbarium14]|uniref:Uma2 family endonuclease n=1 Tax=Microcoleus sp. herbarium14 TaxID=3055439 RepID=UPI002FD206F5